MTEEMPLSANTTPPALPICDYEGSTYRTDFWEGRGREYEDGAERIALRRLLPPTGRRLLDVGAGFGRLAPLYAGYDEVILLDYSRSQLEYARQRLGDGRFIYVAADLYRLPLASDAVDTTVMVRVLHHLADVPLALGQIHRVLAAQGTFILEFANKRHAKNILRYLLRRGMNPFDPLPYEFAPLHYDFHPRWVRQQLGAAGFKVEQRLAVSFFRAALCKRLVPTKLLIAADGALQRVSAPLALSPSIFLRSRAQKAAERPPAERNRLFRCPTCGAEPLEQGEQALHCPNCAARWPIEGGIYIFK